jgi:hypothetical protein
MSELRRHAEDYLRLRRSLGFKLILHGPLLAQFVDYLDAAGADAHHRAGDLIRPVPPGCPAHRLGTPAFHGARLRPLPAGDRPRDRGPSP